MTMKVVAEIMYYISNWIRKRYKCPHGGQEIPLKKRGSQCVFQSAMEWSYKQPNLFIEYHPGGGGRSGGVVLERKSFFGKSGKLAALFNCPAGDEEISPPPLLLQYYIWELCQYASPLTFQNSPHSAPRTSDP